MAQNSDMINLLPNDLLVNIISLIPFKEAARTSILSERGLHLWKHSTNVEFNEHYFSISKESFHRERIIQRKNFVKFITSWIENNKDFIIEKFSLTLADFVLGFDYAIIKLCISFATRNGVKDLVLDFSNPDWAEEDFAKPEPLFELPTKVYDHKTLKSLKLVSCSFVDTKLIKLDALKEVSFGWMELKNDTIKLLLSNCKMIESLTMKNCWISTRFECCRSNPSLKRIVVVNCKFVYAGLKINAPNLDYFKYYGKVISFSMQNSLHMEEVDIDFGLEYEFDDDCGFIYKTVTDFKRVKVLTICSYILRVLSYELEPMLEEDEMNTRHLKLKTNLHNKELGGVSFLLNSCPVLELLTIDLGLGRFFDRVQDDAGDYFDGYLLDEDDNNQRSWLDYENIFPCLTSTLKIVEINRFRGTRNEVLLLQFVIRNGSLLQRININVKKGDALMMENYRNIEDFVMTIPRASGYLEIFFHY